MSLLVAVLISISAAACVRQQPAESARTTGKCTTDENCPSGFCDRGVCATPAGIYGRPCQPAPRTPEGLRDAKLNVCGAYLCIDGRCRSCTSDEECRSELGSPRCYKAENEPGSRCGR